ncbi:MAG: hypothetical protein KAH24_07555 [Holophagae bacterium]|nr:hypothetical protein [Holophagae bacterium]
MKKLSHEDFVIEQKLKMLNYAEQLLENEIDLISGCRNMFKANEAINGELRKWMNAIYQVVDETEGILLLNHEKMLCTPKYLAKNDENSQKIINLNLENVLPPTPILKEKFK